MKSLLWIDLEPAAADQQMAIDTACVDAARDHGVTIFRLYRWLGDTVSLGAHERAVGIWNRERLQADGITVVRRPTGGRAVWHDATDLTYAWAGPVNGPAGVRRIYRELHEQLATAISGAEQPVTLAGPRRSPGLVPGACFDVPVGGEVLVGSRKTIGSAQRVYRDHLLQHGAIALSDRSPLLARYRQDGGGIPAPQRDGELPMESTAASIVAAWRGAGAEPIDTELKSRIVLATVEHRSRYQDPAWTWRR